MRLEATALLVGLAVAHASVKGVDPANQALYVPDANGNWACLGHPEIVIPFDRVNDDYCDCPDGSDEPGTGACPNGLFYCANKGHFPGHLKSTRVHDGVCDYDVCCDGSDELEGVCDDKCAEIHAEYVAKSERELAVLRKGLAAREPLVKKAAEARDQQQKDIVTKERQLAEKQKSIVIFQKALDEALEEQAARGIVEKKTPEEIIAIADRLESVRASLQAQIDSAIIVQVERDRYDSIFDTLKSSYNPNFNDPAVKDAIRAWEETKVNAGTAVATVDVSDLGAAIAELRQFKPASSESDLGGIGHLLAGARDWLADMGLVAHSARTSDSGETYEVRKARESVETIEREISELSEAIATNTADLSANYGPDDVLRALKGTCFENNVGEYDYEVCFYGQTTQKGKGSHTNLGSHATTTFELDGSLTLAFENGARCWNGPIRRATVEVICGSVSEILLVNEPEKCEYFLKMSSPAVCAPQHIDNYIVHSDL